MFRITIKEKPTFKKKRDNYARRLKAKKLLNYLQRELKSTTTHGLPYIANTEIHWFERVFWAACFIISCAIIFFLLSAQYARLVAAPIVNNVEKDYLNWNVSYPSIVLCPINKLDDRILADFVNETLNSTGHNLESYYASIVYVSLDALNIFDLPSPDILKLINPDDYAIIASNLFKKFDNMTLSTPIPWPVTIGAYMTEMGMCHIINSNVALMDDPTTWSDDNRVEYEKTNIDLSIHDLDFFVQILNYAEAYKIYTLSPDEVILNGAPSMTFNNQGFLSVGMRITSIRASEDLKLVPLENRQCRFIHETTSRRYSVYSYNRCLLECRINIIVKLCGCVPHFYKPIDDERVCNLAELECVLEYKREIMSLSISNETMMKFGDIDSLPRSSRDCGCLGNCEEDVFKIEREEFMPQHDMNRMRMSVSSFPKVRVRREIIFSFSDLFLKSGGVVNLCIGSSVISIMELLLIALRIPIYEIMQIVKGIWRRYRKSRISRMALKKKQI